MYEPDRSVRLTRMDIQGRSLQQPKTFRAWLLDPKGNIRRCGNRYVAVLSATSDKPPCFGTACSDYSEAALAFDRETRIESKVRKGQPIMGELPGPLVWAILLGVVAMIGLAVLVANKSGFISFDSFIDYAKGAVTRGN